MRIRIFKKGNKYKKKFSLDTEDWLSIISLLAFLVIAVIQLILWS